MTPSPEKQQQEKLIHVGKIYGKGPAWEYLFLRKTPEGHFQWYEEHEHQEKPTQVTGLSIEEALRLAPRHWSLKYFKTLNCGFRYTLPERDEHGINALFHQMAASYASMNGVYYDEELGNNCFVQNASEEALSLWRRLKTEKRL